MYMDIKEDLKMRKHKLLVIAACFSASIALFAGGCSSSDDKSTNSTKNTAVESGSQNDSETESSTEKTEENETTSNQEGSITWTYDESTRTLTLSGTSDMSDYNGYSFPWDEGDYAKKLVIEEGITEIGDYFFDKTT